MSNEYVNLPLEWLKLAILNWHNEDRLFSERANHSALVSTFLVLGWLAALQCHNYSTVLAISVFGFIFTVLSILQLQRTMRALYGYQNVTYELEKFISQDSGIVGPFSLRKELSLSEKEFIVKDNYANRNISLNVKTDGGKRKIIGRFIPTLPLTVWGVQGLILSLWTYALIDAIELLNKIKIVTEVQLKWLIPLILLISFFVVVIFIGAKRKHTN